MLRLLERTRQAHPAFFNAAHAVAEYISQPLGMLLAAPYLLHHLGSSQFGIWILATAAVSGGNLLSTGFGDAAVKYGAMYRGRNDSAGIARVVRNMMTVNLALSGLLAFALWSLAPYAARHVAHIEASLQLVCIQSFRIGSLLLVVRSLDNVFASTLRAFERYAPPVRISIFSRASSLIASVVLVGYGHGVVAIMLATLCISMIALVAQGIAVRVVVGSIVLLPSFHRETLSMIAGFGSFSWLQAVSALVFGQADRLIIGMVLGAPAVACYALCAQAAQTIHGVAGAGLHILFPHLSSRFETEPLADLKHTVWIAFKTNVALAVLLGVPMTFLSRPILSLWMGAEFSHQAWLILSILGVSFALFALNVTAHYALLALGQVRLVTALNLVAGVAMLALMLPLTAKFGMVGTACSRLVTGPITWILYIPLYRMMRAKAAQPVDASSIVAWENSL
ncbi:MAG TPA: oligosaccharide flippase family protein [Acidobacteriaceae bacterium]|jgi:O-antigen/teichoic acid export membrane protein